MGKWKDAIINKALMLNAYEILMGTETLTSVGEDTAAMASFKARQYHLASHIGSTLNDAHRALLKNATPSIAPNDAYGIWMTMVNHLKSKTTDMRYFAVQGMMALRKGDARHENETYSAYGARCIRETNVLTGSEAKTVAQAATLASSPCHRRTRSCTDFTWNADSGATAHMTPHREWIQNMEPCRVPVQLANNDVIWATGCRTMVFSPLIDGKPSKSVVFKRVLYVPNLESNLFSVLSVVRQNKLKVIIEDDTMLFIKDGAILFTGSVHRNVATLNGTTLEHSEQLFITKTTRSLLHQHLGHIGKD